MDKQQRTKIKEQLDRIYLRASEDRLSVLTDTQLAVVNEIYQVLSHQPFEEFEKGMFADLMNGDYPHESYEVALARVKGEIAVLFQSVLLMASGEVR